ncbi:MAG: serine hydrolase [Bacteroidetes bacterium]|nr:serine hydrolase [Bacteroidota bacterium]MBK9673648.1 serine hydrolase [Bacteroidota bacterium]MBK9799059.1 serine hydrolase [Bacteroidota bacterium]
MKIAKQLLKWIVIILVVASISLAISGKTYLFKAIANTYLKGRSGPSISEYKIFSYHTVLNDSAQNWPSARDFNKNKLSAEQRVEFEDYKTTAFLVLKNDSVKYEEYWDGFSDTSHTNSFSMGKSIVSILVGIAIDEHKIKSVDQPIVDFIPEFAVGANAKVTVKHLLTMSSGINFDEDYINPFAYPAAAYYGSDLKALTYDYQVTEEPGKNWKYLSGNTELLGFVLEKATGKSISEYASEKLWKPMGANHPAYWSLDHEGGVEKAYCCFNSNARDFARFGSLYLHQGSWKGKQLVSKQYVQESIRAADLIDDNGGKNNKYGYSWWLLNYKNHPIYYMRGILGQYVFVIPDKNMVVVRLGHKRSTEKINDHPKDVYLFLDAALAMD